VDSSDPEPTDLWTYLDAYILAFCVAWSKPVASNRGNFYFSQNGTLVGQVPVTDKEHMFIVDDTYSCGYLPMIQGDLIQPVGIMASMITDFNTLSLTMSRAVVQDMVGNSCGIGKLTKNDDAGFESASSMVFDIVVSQFPAADMSECEAVTTDISVGDLAKANFTFNDQLDFVAAIANATGSDNSLTQLNSLATDATTKHRRALKAAGSKVAMTLIVPPKSGNMMTNIKNALSNPTALTAALKKVGLKASVTAASAPVTGKPKGNTAIKLPPINTTSLGKNITVKSSLNKTTTNKPPGTGTSVPASAGLAKITASILAVLSLIVMA